MEIYRFSLFYFVFEGNFQVQAPPGGLIYFFLGGGGQFNGGFFALRVWGFIFGGACTGGAYFRNFTVVD